MSYLHLTRTRTRDRTPEYDRSITKRITLSDNDGSDNGQDDYPYSSSHRPSRALITRNAPTQLERYNIWSDRHRSEDRPVDRDYEMEKSRLYRHTSRHHHDHSDNDRLGRDPEERAFRMRVAATFSRPEHHHHHRHEHLSPTGATFRRKEKWVDEGWEMRERSRSRSRSRDGFWGHGGFWGDEKSESETEKWSRYRMLKGTKTEEWRPLSGWRRA